MSKKILIVDDELQIRELLYDLFSRKGYKVFAAARAEEAIEIIRKENPDTVLLDLKMPNTDGIETLKRVRKFGFKNKILVLTGLEDEEIKKEALLSGADGFLTKQLDLKVILKAEGGVSQKAEHKVLIADDDPGIQALLRDFLIKKGFNPIIAKSGEEALEKVNKDKPAMVLLDIKMPGMDGLMALKKIKEINQRIGVIMITGVGEEQIAIEAMDAGAFDYIVKPLNLDYLEMCLLAKSFFD